MTTKLEGLHHNERQSRKSIHGLDMADRCRENADSLEKYGQFYDRIGNGKVCKYTEETGFTYFTLT